MNTYLIRLRLASGKDSLVVASGYNYEQGIKNAHCEALRANLDVVGLDYLGTIGGLEWHGFDSAAISIGSNPIDFAGLAWRQHRATSRALRRTT